MGQPGEPAQGTGWARPAPGPVPFEDRRVVALLAVVVAVFAWGFGPLFVRGIGAGAETIVFYRLWVAQPLIVCLAYGTGGRLSMRLMRRSVITGACFGASVIFAFASFRETSIVNASLIPALQPALVLLLAGRMFGERRAPAELLYAVLALAGAIAVVFGASHEGASIVGDVLAFANLLLFTGYFLLAKHARDRDVHSWSFIAAVFLWAAILATPWCVLTSSDLGSLHGVDWIWLVLLVLGPGVIGHGFITWAHRYVDVPLTSLIALGNPVVSTVGAWIVFGQSLQPTQMAGVVVVLVALGMLIRAQRGVAAAAEAAATQDLLDATE